MGDSTLNLNLDKLTQEQLATLRQGVVSGLNRDQIGAMVDIFSERNSMADPANAPGPAKPPLPAALDPQAKPVKRTYANMPPELKKSLNSTMKLTAAAIPFVGEAGIVPSAISLLNYGTTETPADLGTTALLHGAGSLLKPLKVAGSRGLNTVNRMAQGLGMYEAGNQAHAALSGAPQPTLDPRQMDGKDLLYGGLSALLGASQGRAEVAPAPTKADLFKSAMAQWQEHQNATKQAQAALAPAAMAHADAETALKSFENETGIAQKLKKEDFLSYLRAQQQFGKTTAETQQVSKYSQLKEAAEKAREAKRQAEIAINDLKASEPPKPEQTKVASVKDAFLMAGKHAVPSLGGAGFGTLLHANPFLGALSGIAMEKMLSSPSGRKLVDFFVNKVGPGAPGMIPALVNERNEK